MQKSRKKLIAIVMAALVSTMALTGCTGGSSGNNEPKIVSQIESSVVNSESESAAASEGDNTTAESQADASEEATSQEESTPEETNNVFHVGDVIDTGKATVTLKSVDDYTSDNEFMQPKDGEKIIGAYFIIENTGDSDLITSSYDFKCYADNSVVKESFYGDNILSSDSISPGRKNEGYIWFEIPENAEKIEIEYEMSWWTQDKAIFIVKE